MVASAPALADGMRAGRHRMAQALLIASSPQQSVPDELAVQNLFAQSHWTLEREPGLASAIRRLASESFPAVICDIADWKRTAAALQALERPPILIALSNEVCHTEGVHAMAPNVFCVHTNHTATREIFSLLNHAWRMRNGER